MLNYLTSSKLRYFIRVSSVEFNYIILLKFELNYVSLYRESLEDFFSSIIKSAMSYTSAFCWEDLYF